MSIEDINAAAAAQNALTARINSFLDDADAEIAARQVAYDALANDLSALFWGQVYVDQLNGDDANPGTLAEPVQTLKKAGEVLPNGTTTKIVLIGDYRFEDTEFFDRGTYQIVSADNANKSVISFAPEIDGVKVNAPRFNANEPFVEFWFDNVVIHLEPVSAHISYPWCFSSKGSVGVYLVDSQITVAAGCDRKLIENNGVVMLTVKSTTYPAEMAGLWVVGVAASTPSADVPRVLTTLATL